MNQAKSLTVIGATGSLAVPVIKELMRKGVQVKAVVRDLDKARTLLPAEATLVQADVQDVHSLKKALQGSGAVYLSLNTTSLDPGLPFHTEREGIINVVEAAKSTGVSQIMQLAGIDLLHKEFAVEGMEYGTNVIRKPGMEAIRQSGIPYTFFHGSMFLDSIPGMIENSTFYVMGDFKYPIYFTNTTDLATHIYHAIDNPQAYNQAFAVQGKEGVNFVEAAKRFVAAFDPEVKVEELPLETVRQLGFPQEQEDFMYHMLSYVEQLNEKNVSDKTWQLLGEPEQNIESFARSLKAS